MRDDKLIHDMTEDDLKWNEPATIPQIEQTVSSLHQSNVLIMLLAWVAALIASSLPYIIWSELAHTTPFWFSQAQAGLLILLFLSTFFVKSILPLRGLFLAFIAFAVGWLLLRTFINTSLIWISWQHRLPLGLQFITAYAVRLLPAFLMALTLIGSNIRRQTLFLIKGNPHLPVQFLRQLNIKKSISWLQFAAIFLIIAAILLPLYLAMTIQLKNVVVWQILLNLPAIFLAALFNSFSEEFQFRSVLFARLLPVLGDRQALWLTTVVFALGHFYGQPSGILGVLLAGVAGWIWGMSILETKGIAIAWALHLIQDSVILTFLAIR